MTLTLTFVIYMHVMILILEVTSFSPCPGNKQCNCSRDFGKSEKRQENAFDTVECSGEIRLPNISPNIRKASVFSLTLRNTSEKSLTANSFKNMKLEKLSVTDQVTSFANNSLSKLAKTLKVLHLQNVNISKTWKLDFLQDLSSLEALSLDRNGIYPEHFPDHVFNKLNLTSLTFLSLQDCGIALMFDQALYGLDTLEVLDLSNNHLSTVPKTILLLQNLKKIDLSHNMRLIYVEDQAFKTLKRLEEIDLSHTFINTLLEDSFYGLEECLQIIRLHHAKMAHGYFSTMRMLQKLRLLDISYNYITEMHNTSFIGFYSLQELDISGQRDVKGDAGTTIIDSAFRGLETKLLSLKLRDLQMTSLPLAALSSLRYLHILDVSDNNFTEVYESFFYGIKAKTIIANNCSISQIHKDAFTSLSPGVNFYFDNNHIKNISFILEMEPCEFRTLSLKNNSVECDCDVIDIASSNRVPDLIGTCADSLYRGENFVHLRELPIARNICDSEHFQNNSQCVFSYDSSKSPLSFHCCSLQVSLIVLFLLSLVLTDR